MSDLNAWDSFYVIIGLAAGALIGLQFVVMTLIAERLSLRVAEAGNFNFMRQSITYCFDKNRDAGKLFVKREMDKKDNS